jgi:biotin operon repressor
MAKKQKTSQKDKVLNALVKAGDAISAKRIATQTRIPYDSVSKRVHDLRKSGYAIMTDVRSTKNGPRTVYELA